MAKREDRLFRRYLETADPEALGKVFDLVAPRLLGLAVHLARDPARAEDLLQTTFLTAIQRAESFDPDKPVLPWLIGILSRHAVRAREKETRSVDPDRLDRPTPTDPAVKAENAELVQMLRTRMERLPEKYRQPLLLNLVHGMQPAEIAEVLGVAPGTLRMRLHRGLAKLRGLLPAGLVIGTWLSLPLRGVAGVRRAVLDRARGVRPALFAAGSALALKKLLVPALVAIVVFACWVVWPIPPLGPADAQGALGHAPTLLAQNEDERPESTTAVTERAGERLPVVSPAEMQGSLRLRVVSGVDDRPVPHVGIFLTPQDGTDPLLSRRQGSTGEDGTVLFEGLEPGTVKIELDRDRNYRTLQIEGRETEHVLRILEGITVEGRVLDAQDGPVPHASLWVDSYRDKWSKFEVGSADAYGRFRLEELSGTFNSVGASAPGHAPSYMYRIQGEAGETIQIDVHLEGVGASLVGRVVDCVGEPVSGAVVIVGGYGGPSKRIGPRLTLGGWAARHVLTDEQGSFQASGLPEGWVQLLVRARGNAPLSQHVQLEVGRVNDITLELAQGANLRGRVSTPDRAPIAGANILIEAYGPYEQVSTVTASDGSYSVDGISSERIRLQVRADGFAIHTEEIDASPGVTLQWDVQLVEQPVLHGQLVDADDRPLAGWLVSASGSGSGSRLTDAAGRFRTPFESGNPQELIVTRSLDAGGGWITCSWLGLVRPQQEELVVRVPDEAMPSSYVRGRLLEADGSPVPDQRGSLTQGRLAAGRFSIERSSGAFEIGPLASGSFWLEVGGPWDGTSPTRLGPYRVGNREVLELGDVRLPAPGTVSLSIRRSDGEPIDDPSVFFFTPEGWEIIGAYVDAEGRCEQPLRPGTYRVRTMVANATWATRYFEIRSGEVTDLEIVLEPAVRRYVSFPVPEPEGWDEGKRVRFTIRDPAGRLLDEDDYDPVDRDPYRYMPSFAPGRYTLDMELDTGRRYRGTFLVSDLRPSQVPIKVSVTPIR